VPTPNILIAPHSFRFVGKLYAENDFFKKSLMYTGKESARREGEIESRVKFMIISEKSDCISINRSAELLDASIARH